MEIEAKIVLSRVDNWPTDWSSETDKQNQLDMLKLDMKMAIHVMCGIDLNNISVELFLNQQ